MPSAICFNMEQSKIFSSGNGVTNQSFVTFRFAKYYLTIPTFNKPEREGFWKQYGERTKCWSPEYSPFPTMFCKSSMKKV